MKVYEGILGPSRTHFPFEVHFGSTRRFSNLSWNMIEKMSRKLHSIHWRIHSRLANSNLSIMKPCFANLLNLLHPPPPSIPCRWMLHGIDWQPNGQWWGRNWSSKTKEDSTPKMMYLFYHILLSTYAVCL